MHGDIDDDELIEQRWREGLHALGEPGDTTGVAVRVTARVRDRRRRHVLTATIAVFIAAAAGIAGAVVASRSGSGRARVQAGAPPSASSTTASPLDAEAQPALAAWSRFPVDASPRPLILLQDTELLGTRGFPDNLSKDAYDGGSFVPPAQFPASPPAAGGYPVVSAQDALVMLKAEASPGPPPATSLTITDVRLDTTTFPTDRGARTVPAWLFSFRGVPDAAAVAAVAPPARFVAPGLAELALRRRSTPNLLGVGSLGGTSVSADGRDLTVTFVGGPPGTGPCSKQYGGHATESRTAVAIAIEPTGTPRPEPSVACSMVGYRRQVVIHLDTPLGERVLIDAIGGDPLDVAP
ncbi:MAG TPA: hypothetical protein VFW74_18325 [Acidimicrobiia bacterium]|nr:hypothetical protein [Acidimicrobiia bacterium]